MSSKGNLRNRFQDYGVAPSENAWQNISALIGKKKKKKAVIWWILGSSGLAASLIFSLFYAIPSAKKSTYTSRTNPTMLQVETLQNLDNLEKNNTKSFEEKQVAVKHNKTISPITKPTKQVINGQESFSPENKKPQSTLKLKNDLATQQKKAPLNKLENPNYIGKKLESKLVEEDIVKLKVDKILAQKTELIAVNFPSFTLDNIPIKNDKTPRWEWGVELGSSRSINSNNFDQDYWVLPTDIGSTGNLNEAFQPGGPVYFSKINRPIQVSLALKYRLSPRFYLKASPRLIMLNGINIDHTTIASVKNLRTRFYGVSGGINMGYYFLKRNRFALDIEAGVSFEKMLLTDSFNPDKVPLNLWGNNIGLGFNYQLTENTLFRIAPNYSWIYGKSENIITRQFQALNNIGIGLSISKQF